MFTRLFTLLILCTTRVCLAQPLVVPDTTFDKDGMLIGNLRYRTGEDIDAKSIVLQKDGKFIIAASGDAIRVDEKRGCVLARYNADGTLDKEFGDNGKKLHPFNVETLIPQADGKILAYGYNKMARFNADGSADVSFGNNGALDFQFVYSVLLRPDGNIWVATALEKRRLIISCYNEKGVLNTAFGTKGVDTLKLPEPKYSMRGLYMNNAPDNKINICASVWVSEKDYSNRSHPGIYFIQYDENGKHIQTTDISTLKTLKNITDMKVQPDGKVLLAGVMSNQIDLKMAVLIRLLPTGKTDTTFGSKGIVANTQVRADWDGIVKIEVLNDGKIMLLANNNMFADNDALIFRYLPDGREDTGFGSGKIVADYPEIPHMIKTLPDGKIMVLGRFMEKGMSDRTAGYTNFVIHRFVTVSGPKTNKTNVKKPR